ncbi:MAG: efflux RND transporter permease subunit [Patescibacteria group bacterium]
MAEIHESLYLKNLHFDQRLKNSFVAKYLANTRLIFLIIICLVIAGSLSFASLPRQLNPDVDLAIVNVVTTLPGAAPLDVENLVTKKIEKSLSNLTNVDLITSQSQESVSVITIQFLGNQDSNKALDEVRQKMDLVSDLPENAGDPVVQKLDFNDQPVWLVALTADTDPLSLSKIATTLEEKIEDVSGIRKVDIVGKEAEEIVIELNRASLNELNVNSSSIIQALKSNDLSFPAGRVTVHNTQYTLTIDNELTSIQQLRNLPLTINKNSIPLGQIANIYQRSKETATPILFRVNGKRTTAVELSIFKTDTETIDGAYQKAKKVIDDELKFYPQIHSYDVINSAKETNQSFDDLQGNFINSILFVLVALSLFLGVRQAVIAAISLPLTLMCTFIIMGVSGVTLSFLAIFSLLLAISLIGDDAIVIVQSNKEYQEKFSPFEAGLLVWRDFFIPIWTGTLTVVWSFVPLLLASGIIGKFIRPIPIVVSATLLSSTAIATLINLPLNILLAEMKVPKRLRILFVLLGTAATLGLLYVIVQRSPLAMVALIVYVLLLILAFFNRSFIAESFKKSGQMFSQKFPRIQKPLNWIRKKELLSKPLLDLNPLAARYLKVIEPIIKKRRSRFIVYGVLILLLVLSGIFMGTGLLKNEFFPKTDSNLLFVNVEGPAGWTKEKTDQVMQLVELKLDQIPEIQHSFIQLGSQSSGGGFDAASGGNNTASVTLILEDKEKRQRTSSEISESLREEFKQILEAKVTVQEESGGPPAGSDFQANIKGDDLDTLEEISRTFMDKLHEIDGVTNIESSLKLSAGQIHVDLIPAELAKRNLSTAQVGEWLRTAISGQESGNIVINDSDSDIILTIDKQDRTVSYLQNLVLPSPQGQYTLNDVARFRLEQSPTSITREDGKRVVRVNASATGKQTAPEMLKAFNEKVKGYELPEGYTWDVGGANEENQKSVNSILQAMIISFTLILITMVLLLNSFRQALIVLVVIPLSIAGVFINFTIFGIPLSFPSLIGVLALFGIVVNNALMLMDKINQNMHENFPVYQGIADACASRIEPIFLTAVTGILGLLPITISDPLWRGLGGAIVAGLSVSGILVLFLIPSLYVEVFGKELLKKEKLSAKK